MEKTIHVKRKAQKLARDGQVKPAIEEMRKLLEEPEVDPYDHVYLGDLLMRIGEREEALSAYLEAIRTYEQVGLYRNAIAVGKKILRIDHARMRVHRILGDLYDREGLKGEAVPHYLVYLDSFTGQELPPEEFYETLEKAASLSGHQVEVALRLAELFQRVQKGDRAADLLQEVADHVARTGSIELAEELGRKAREAGASVAPRGEQEEESPEAGVEGIFDLSAGPDLESGRATLGGSRHGDSARGTEIDFGLADASAWDLSSEPEVIESSSMPVLPEIEPEIAPDSGALVPLPSYGADPAPEMEETFLASESYTPTEEEALEEEALIEVEPSAEQLVSPGLVGLRERADQAFRSERYDEARALYLQIHHQEPQDCEILAQLLETARQQQDRQGQILYLSLLGDARIQNGELEIARTHFVEVLRLDPGNVTAERRLARFRELGLVERQEAPPSGAGPGADMFATGGAHVSVKGEASERPNDEWVDLAGLLEEFKTGLKNQMDAGDYQSHYDLAVSHYEMGLYEESLEELDQVLACPDLPEVLEQKARELRGSSLLTLKRSREAVHEFREALEKAGKNREARRTALYHLGCALESAEEWQEATEKFTLLMEEVPSFLDAAERLQRCRDHASNPSRPPA